MSFRLLILAVFFLTGLLSPIRAAISIVDGGISPDGGLAVVVLDDAPSKSSTDSDNTEFTAYLMNYRTKKIIGPLEEVDLEGGDFGRGKGEAEAFWSKDRHLLAINTFNGFSGEFSVIYKIKNNRAFPQKMESPFDSPLIKGLVVPRGHSYEVFSKWISDTEFEYNLVNFLPSGGTALYRETGKEWVVAKFTKGESN